MIEYSTFNTSNCTALLCCIEDETSKYVLITLLLFLGVLVVLGNMLVVVIIYSYKIMRTSANSLLCSLALAGVLHGATLTPLYVLVILKNDIVIYHTAYTLQYIIFICSLMIVAYMAYDRLVYICKPVKYELSFLKALLGLVQFKIIPLLLAIIIYFTSDTKTLLLAAHVFIIICLVAIAVLLLSFSAVYMKKATERKADVFLHSEQQSALTVFLLYITLMTCVMPSIIHGLLIESSWRLCMARVILLMLYNVLNPVVIFWRKPAMRSIAGLMACKQKKVSRSSRQSTASYIGEVFTIS